MIDTAITNPRKPASWRVVVSLVAGIFFLLAGCGGPPKHPTWNNATGAEQHERLMWQAIRDHDWKNLEYRLAPTFVGVDARGQSFDRAGWVAYWKSGTFTDVSLAEISVQPQGQDMVVTYILHLGGTPDTRNAPGDGLRVVSVWQTVKNGWVLTTTTMTPIAPNQK